MAISEVAWRSAAWMLDAPVHHLQAVAEVEALKGGFLADGRPRILFEQHKFHKFTSGQFDASHPDISSPQAGGYAGGAGEYRRFEAAYELSRRAAQRATSWGRFQIMGFNWALTGCKSLAEFLHRVAASEEEQLRLFVRFVEADRELHAAIRTGDWGVVSDRYNGPLGRERGYPERLAAAAEKWSA